MTVLEVRAPNHRPGMYVNWSAWRHGFPHQELTWRACAMCWGQRSIYEEVRKPNGQLAGLRPFPCPSCLGIGAKC